MAREVAKLQLQNSPHPRNDEWTCRCTVKARQWRRTKRSKTYTANIVRRLLECLRSRRPGDNRRRSSESPTTTKGDHGGLEQETAHRETRRTTSNDVDRQSRTVGSSPRR